MLKRSHYTQPAAPPEERGRWLFGNILAKADLLRRLFLFNVAYAEHWETIAVNIAFLG